MKSFESLLDDGINKKEVLGAIVTIFGKEGSGAKDLYQRAVGKQRSSSEQATSQDSTFWAYSFTKLITTLCVLQCVERGQISLDEEVAQILPELATPSIISRDLSDDLQLTPAITKITLRHLLTHTSGLTYDAMNHLTVAWRKSRGEHPLVMSGRLIESYDIPLLFEPGTSWVYGGSIDWAGLLVERLNGNTKLGEYMGKNIFQPLGIESSTFDIKSHPNIEQRLLEMSIRGSDGALISGQSPYNNSAPDHSGGMGLVTSVNDFATILKDLLKENPTILKAETVESMFTPQFELGAAQHQGLLAGEATHKQLTGDTTGNAAISFGLGGMVILEDVPNLPAKTLTWQGMPNCAWFVSREKGLGGLFVTQVLPARDNVISKLLASFEQETFTTFGRR